jgi:PAT family beta-lactamase induction signal transducer AmpG
VVSADNLAAGFASAAFVAFLSSLTNVSFTAVQYAIFSSLMTLLPKTLGGYSGGMVEVWGYPYFFVLTTIIGLPVLWLVHMAGKRLAVKT